MEVSHFEFIWGMSWTPFRNRITLAIHQNNNNDNNNVDDIKEDDHEGGNEGNEGVIQVEGEETSDNANDSNNKYNDSCWIMDFFKNIQNKFTYGCRSYELDRSTIQDSNATIDMDFIVKMMGHEDPQRFIRDNWSLNIFCHSIYQIYKNH